MHERACWTDPPSKGGRIINATDKLVGSVVVSIDIIPPALDLDLRFIDVTRLCGFANTRDEIRNSWYLVDPLDQAVNAGPAGRIEFDADWPQRMSRRRSAAGLLAA